MDARFRKEEDEETMHRNTLPECRVVRKLSVKHISTLINWVEFS